MEYVEPATIRDALSQIRGVHLGVDIGQKQDYTAIVVAEVGERPSTQTYRHPSDGHLYALPESTYRIQELRRLPLGTPFLAVAQEVVGLAGAVYAMERALKKEGRLSEYAPGLTVDIWLDATGVGAPLVELVGGALRETSKTDRAQLHPITFTYGDRFDRAKGSLGKAYLVSRLQVLLEQSRLELPRDEPETAAMVDELKSYEIRIDTDANDKYGAFLVGTHDDLVTALGLACIEDPGYYSVQAGPRLWA